MCVLRCFKTPWTRARQAPLFMELFRQKYWSGYPFLSPGDCTYSGIEPRSPALQADSLPSEPSEKSILRRLLGPYFLVIDCLI